MGAKSARTAPESTQFDPLDTAPGKGNPPVGSPVRVGRLASLVSVRAELSRLYREARRRHGRYPDALTAQRLASVLGDIRNAIELEEIRGRLDVLEKRLG